MFTKRRKQILSDLIMSKCTNLYKDTDDDWQTEISLAKLVNYIGDNIDLIREIVKNDQYGIS
jgi:hypothetical protein